MISLSRQIHLVLFQSFFFHQCFHRKLASSSSHAMNLKTPVWVVVVRRAENPVSCGPGSIGLGRWEIFVFWDLSSESERCLWLGTWTAESCTVLLAGVLGPVGGLDKTYSPKSFPRFDGRSTNCEGAEERVWRVKEGHLVSSSTGLGLARSVRWPSVAMAR